MATFLPAFPALAPGAIFIKGFTNNSASAATVAQYVTFGHCFQKGQIASGGGLEADIGGTNYPCQLDVKTSYADGSVCHAMISMQVPAIAKSTTVWAQFSPAAPPGGAALSLATAVGSTTLSITLAATALPDWAASTTYQINTLIKPTTGNVGGYTFQYPSDVNGTPGTSGTAEPVWPQTVGDSVADGTLLNNTNTTGISGWLNIGVTFTGTITQDLIAAVKNSTDLWLSGPLAVQARAYVVASNPASLANVTVNSSLPPLMRIAIDLTAYADGTVLADVCVANDSFATLLSAVPGGNAYGGTQAYTATLTLNGSVAFTSAALVHNALEDWAWEAGTVPHLVNCSQDLTLQVVHNPTDFIEAQAVIPYDCTVGAGSDGNGTLFATDAQTIVSSAGFAQPMANPGNVVNTNMPMVGVSYPNSGVGPNCFWQMWWFTTQNYSFYGAGLEAAKVNGFVPWHMWNPNTGRYWSNADSPGLVARQSRYYDQWGQTGFAPSYVPTATAENFWSIDGEHYPDLVYIPYLLTGRRYFLDQLVAAALYMQQSDTDALKGYYAPVPGQVLYFTQGLTCRTQGWGFRHSLYAAYACPDGAADKTWFRKVLDNNLFWVLGSLQFYQSFQGACYGWLPANYGNHAEIAPWQDDYTLYVVQLAATMGHPLALQLAWWMLHFRTGVLLNGSAWPPDGYPAADAVVYDILMWNTLGGIGFGYESWPPANDWTGLEQLMRISSVTAGSQTSSNTANAVFQGTITSSGTLTVSSMIAGALATGMTLYAAPDSGAPSTQQCQITGGSGDTWTTNYGASAYTGTMSASNYNLPGEYVYWWAGSGGGGGNTDDYSNLLYATLIQAGILGHPDASSALSTLTALVDTAGTPVPGISSTADWQNAMVMRLVSRTWNDSQVFPAAGAANGIQGQSFGMLGALASRVPSPPPSLGWMRPAGRKVYFGNRR